MSTLLHVETVVTNDAGQVVGSSVVSLPTDAEVAPAVNLGDAIRSLDPEMVRGLVASSMESLADDPYAATLAVIASLVDEATS